MEYYYKDENGNYYNFKNEHNNLIKINEQEWYEHLNEITLKESTQKEIKLLKISELKNKLSSTDYEAIKYAEGLYSDEEYAPTKELRESLREQIRELQKQL